MESAPRTALSAQPALSPLASARDRMNAAASLVTFCRSTVPLTPTGLAAPISVAGAIPFWGQAIMMKVPAEAARAPDGPVQHRTGTFEFWIALTMVRIDESSP